MIKIVSHKIYKSKDFLNIIINVILPVLLGFFIYIAFRPLNLTYYQWLKKLKIDYFFQNINVFFSNYKSFIPNMVIYNVPDGIWTYACTSIFIQIWKKNKLLNFYLIIPFLLSLLIESLQFVKIFPGTFCLFDLLFIILFFTLSIFFTNKILYERSSL